MTNAIPQLTLEPQVTTADDAKIAPETAAPKTQEADMHDTLTP